MGGGNLEAHGTQYGPLPFVKGSQGLGPCFVFDLSGVAMGLKGFRIRGAAIGLPWLLFLGSNGLYD